MLSSALRDQGITECMVTSCDDSPCANGGTCVIEVYGLFCYCPLGFGGITCAESKTFKGEIC